MMGRHDHLRRRAPEVESVRQKENKQTPEARASTWASTWLCVFLGLPKYSKHAKNIGRSING